MNTYYYNQNSYPTTTSTATATATTTYVNAEPAVIYGYPILEEQFEEIFPLQTSAEYVIPATTVCVPSNAAVVTTTAYESENEFFDGIIECLAEESHDEQMPLAVASEAEDFTEEDLLLYSTAETEMIYPAALSYAVPEAKRVDTFTNPTTTTTATTFATTFIEDEFLNKKDYYYYDDFPLDCVAAFESMEVSDTDKKEYSNSMKYQFPTTTTATNTSAVITVNNCQPAFNNELFEVGTIDIDYLKSLNDADEKRARRKEAINRWKTKKSRRKLSTASSEMKHAVKSSVNSIQEVAAAACKMLNPRQKATAKRERENGKFKKAQVTWVSVTDLFQDFK